MKLIPLILLLTFIPTCSPAFATETPNWDRLIPAIIEVESNGDPNAISKAGCIGLMQINPKGAFKEWKQFQFWRHPEEHLVHLLFDAEWNIKIGTWYLKRLYHYYKCDTIEKILMAYNWGIGNCRKNDFNLKKAPRETRNYVKNVMWLYNQGGK